VEDEPASGKRHTGNQQAETLSAMKRSLLPYAKPHSPVCRGIKHSEAGAGMPYLRHHDPGSADGRKLLTPAAHMAW
jgi:hypothetical protein